MRNIEIEGWVLGLVERVNKKMPVEDSREELKADWVADPPKMARQLAAMANAAHGQSILWVIGLDQEKGVVGASNAELANWWPPISSLFDGLAPTFTDLNIPVENKTVVALLFTTDRFPYVVKADRDRLELPWREGRRTRSAKRFEESGKRKKQ